MRATAQRLIIFGLVAWVALALLIQATHVEAADPPTVTAVNPANGPAAGGTVVTITGTGFLAGATVTFNGVLATPVTVVSSTQISATTPAGAQGPATIIVTNSDGQGASLGGFTYLGPVPTITGIAPPSGPSIGGTAVTITGTGFSAGATVRFGGTLATNVTVASATQITATTPARPAGAVTVQVTNADGQSASISNGFTFTPSPPPTITLVTPNSGTSGGGTTVTITGSGFVAGASVRFGANFATSVSVVNASTLTVVTPAGTGTVAVQVTNPDAQSANLPGAFTYTSAPAPVVTAVAPASGPVGGGTSVTITGTGFLPGATVAFGSTNATNVVVVSSTQITATTPAAASAGKVGVKVTNTDGKNHTLASAFTYGAAPSITSISPTAGSIAGGTTVTITGTNFASGATVTFAGVAATSVSVVSTTKITAKTPAHAAGVVSVVVTSGGVSATLTNGFTYKPVPTVASISPSKGPVAGGTTITITGTNFEAGMVVTVGGTNATGVTLVSTTTLRAVTPARPAGTAKVEVRTSDGIVATGTPNFTYEAPVPVGSIVSGYIPTSGIGIFVFSGGPSSLLGPLAADEGCPVSRVAFFTTVAGKFVVYVPGTSVGAVNAAWFVRFPGDIPANTPLIAACN